MALDDFKALVKAAPENSWVRLDGGNHPTDVFPGEALRGETVNNVQRTWTAWAGFAYMEPSKQLLLFGGGHANSRYNGPFHFDLDDLLWHRTFLPTRCFNPFNEGNTDWPDTSILANDNYDWQQAPISAHCYQGNQYLEVLDRFVTFGGAEQGQGGPWRAYDEINSDLRNVGPYILNHYLADPDKVASKTGSNFDTDGTAGSVAGAEAWSVVDKGQALGPNGKADTRVENGVDVVYAGSDGLLRWEIPSDLTQVDRTSIGQGWQGNLGSGAGAIFPDHNIFVAFGDADSGKLVYWDISGLDQVGSQKNVRVDMSGQADWPGSAIKEYGMRYDPERNRLLLANRQGALLALHPPQTLTYDSTVDETGWTIEVITPATADAPTETGTFADRQVHGMWQYARDFDVFLFMGSANDDTTEGGVWAYKPTSWNPEEMTVAELDRQWSASVDGNNDRIWSASVTQAGNSAALNAAATLTAAPSVTRPSIAALPAAATTSAAPSREVSRIVALPATATTVAVPSVTRTTTAALSAQATLTAAAQDLGAAEGAATLAASATVAATPAREVARSAALVASATTAAVSARRLKTAASLAGAATVDATPFDTQTVAGRAALAGVAAQASTPSREVARSAALAGEAVSAARPLRRRASAAPLAGTAALTARVLERAAARLEATGTAQAGAQRRVHRALRLDGQGATALLARATRPSSSRLQGAATITARSGSATDARARLTASATITPANYRARASSAALPATAAQVGVARRQSRAALRLDAQGALSGDAYYIVRVALRLDGEATFAFPGSAKTPVKVVVEPMPMRTVEVDPEYRTLIVETLTGDVQVDP